jgi:hypothetical protein
MRAATFEQSTVPPVPLEPPVPRRRAACDSDAVADVSSSALPQPVAVIVTAPNKNEMVAILE